LDKLKNPCLGVKNPVFMRVCGLKAHFAHFFSLTKCDKKFNIYKEFAKISGQVGVRLERKFYE
jgi:hypothetical protein